MELLDKAQRWADHDPDPATASSLKADALSEALRDSLAPWEKVRRVLVVEALPTTTTGKPDPVAAARLFGS